MWPEVLELRGDQEASFNQHQDRTLLTTNQHQDQVSILINEDSSKDSSKILIEMSYLKKYIYRQIKSYHNSGSDAVNIYLSDEFLLE